MAAGKGKEGWEGSGENRDGPWGGEGGDLGMGPVCAHVGLTPPASLVSSDKPTFRIVKVPRSGFQWRERNNAMGLYNYIFITLIKLNPIK